MIRFNKKTKVFLLKKKFQNFVKNKYLSKLDTQYNKKINKKQTTKLAYKN